MRRFTLSTFVLAIIASATIMLTASPAGACSCGGAEQAFEFSDAVFIGEVERIHDARGGSSLNPAVVILQVSDVYKGHVDRIQGVTTPAFGAGCGFDFIVGEAYVVFGRSDGINDVDAGFYEANLCSGTYPLDDTVPDIDAIPSPPRDAGPPTIAAIQDQLGNPRASIIPEAIIFASVLGLVLGLVAWFSRKSRPAI